MHAELAEMPAVIVDDRAEDRDSMAKQLKLLRPDMPIVEVDTLRTIQEYMCSGKIAGVVFMDLNLHGADRDYRDEGLYSLYDWWEIRPEVPVCIFSGHVQDCQGDLLSASVEIDSLVDFLDKLTYRTEQVRNALKRAETHRKRFKLAVEFEERVKQDRESKAKQDRDSLRDGRELYSQAFTGNDWPARIEAEQRMSGHATLNGAEIFRRIERAVRECFTDSEWAQLVSYSCRFYRFDELVGGNVEIGKPLRDIWNLRNRVVHKPFLPMADTDARKALGVLEEVLQASKLAHRTGTPTA